MLGIKCSAPVWSETPDERRNRRPKVFEFGLFFGNSLSNALPGAGGAFASRLLLACEPSRNLKP